MTTAALGADDARVLRARKLIEGRAPNFHVSAKIAQVMGEQAQHTLNKGLDSAYYREWVLQHLRNFTACTRDELQAVLRAKLPDVLSDAQKRKGPGARWHLVAGGSK